MTTISIIGNVNVGKSTLFNKLVLGANKAIATDFAGVTRDYKIAEAQLSHLNFKLIDTAGFSLKLGSGKDLSGKMERKTIEAVTKSDLVLFMVDGARGVTEHDKAISAWLKRMNLSSVLVVNKIDSKKLENDFYEFYQLGYKDLCAISAEHNLGFNILYDLINEKTKDLALHSHPEYEEDRLKLAIIGRPNVGKSTLINSFLGEERVITGEEAGITRDSIFIDIDYKGNKLQLIDTAGVRRRSRIIEKIEQMSTNTSMHAIKLCDVAALIVDVNNPLENQDLKLASIVLKSQIKPLVLVINKIDSIKMTKELTEDISHVVRTKLSDVNQMKVIYISAINKQNIDTILDECIKLHKLWSTKIPTSALNKWLASAISTHQPPISKRGSRVKIKFISQIGSAPPKFQIFSNQINEISDQYLQYLSSSLKSKFKLHGVPIRLYKKRAENPYA